MSARRCKSVYLCICICISVSLYFYISVFVFVYQCLCICHQITVADVQVECRRQGSNIAFQASIKACYSDYSTFNVRNPFNSSCLQIIDSVFCTLAVTSSILYPPYPWIINEESNMLIPCQKRLLTWISTFYGKK